MTLKSLNSRAFPSHELLTSGWHLAPVSPWETFLLVTTPGEITQGLASVTLFTEGCRAQLHGDPM